MASRPQPLDKENFRGDTLRSPEARGLWSTIRWTFLACLASATPLFLAVVLAELLRRCCQYASPSLLTHPDSIPRLILKLAGVFASIAVLAFAVHQRQRRIVEYLGLVWPQRKEFLSAILALMILLFVSDSVAYLSGRRLVSSGTIEIYKYAQNGGFLLIWLFYIVLAVPMIEELIFRGFLWRGLTSSSIGVFWASVITSAMWASLHIRYEMFFVIQVFILGLFWAWLRSKSGSTILTFVLHALCNAWVVAESAFFTGHIFFFASNAAASLS
jgi:membrane protease YdiL (CAAX protease family)